MLRKQIESTRRKKLDKDINTICSKRANKVYLAVSKKGIEKPNMVQVLILEISERIG